MRWLNLYTMAQPPCRWLNLNRKIDRNRQECTDRERILLFYTCIRYNQLHLAVTVPGSGIKHKITSDFYNVALFRNICANFEWIFRLHKTCVHKKVTAYIRYDHFYVVSRSPIFEKMYVDF